MIFKWGKKSRNLLLTLTLGLAGGACSSSSDSQQETIEADPSQQATEGAADSQNGAENQGDNQASGDDKALANGQGNGTPAGDQGLASLINNVSNGNAASDGGAAAEQPAPEAGTAADLPGQNAEASVPANSAPTEVASPDQTQAPVAEAAPAPASSMPGLPEMGAKLSYIVEKGDTLAKISEKVYGNVKMWKDLARLAGLSDPNKIYPGEVIYYQLSPETSAFASSYESLSRSAVTVVKGDTLAKISAKVYGTPSKWRAIWRENEQVQDPESLTEGGVIYYVNYPKLSATSKVLNDSTKKAQAVSDTQVLELDSFDSQPVSAAKSSVSFVTGHKVLSHKV